CAKGWRSGFCLGAVCNVPPFFDYW
nr:immunoglobulin heavy chain junction region [Macaca mulatta]MOV50072.1 immunoglobulin heavy chain junction region [Macaca mulatta]